MRTIFANIEMPNTPIGVVSMSINHMDICYGEGNFLRLAEGGESRDDGADAKGTIKNLLKKGHPEFEFGFDLAVKYYNDNFDRYVDSEIRDFLELCLKEVSDEEDFED